MCCSHILGCFWRSLCVYEFAQTQGMISYNAFENVAFSFCTAFSLLKMFHTTCLKNAAVFTCYLRSHHVSPLENIFKEENPSSVHAKQQNCVTCAYVTLGVIVWRSQKVAAMCFRMWTSSCSCKSTEVLRHIFQYFLWYLLLFMYCTE